MPSSMHLTFPHDPVLPRVLRPLSAAQSYAVFVVNALLETKQKVDGPSYHSHIAEVMQHHVDTEKDLSAWVGERLARGPVGVKAFDRARKRAEEWLREGRWVASWRPWAGFPSNGPCRLSLRPVRKGQHRSRSDLGRVFQLKEGENHLPSGRVASGPAGDAAVSDFE